MEQSKVERTPQGECSEMSEESTNGAAAAEDSPDGSRPRPNPLWDASDEPDQNDPGATLPIIEGEVMLRVLKSPQASPLSGTGPTFSATRGTDRDRLGADLGGTAGRDGYTSPAMYPSLAIGGRSATLQTIVLPTPLHDRPSDNFRPSTLDGIGGRRFSNEPYGAEMMTTADGSDSDADPECAWWLNNKPEILLETFVPPRWLKYLYYIFWIGAHILAIFLRRESGHTLRWHCIDPCGNPCPSGSWWHTPTDVSQCAVGPGLYTSEVDLSALNRRVHVVLTAFGSEVTPTLTQEDCRVPPSLGVTVSLCRLRSNGECKGYQTVSAILAKAVLEKCATSDSDDGCWGPEFVEGMDFVGGGLHKVTLSVNQTGILPMRPALGVHLLVEKGTWVGVEICFRCVVCLIAFMFLVTVMVRMCRRNDTSFGSGPGASGFMIVHGVIVMVCTTIFANPLHLIQLFSGELGGVPDFFEKWGSPLFLFSICGLVTACVEAPVQGQRVIDREAADGIPNSPLDSVKWLSLSHVLMHKYAIAYWTFSMVCYGLSDGELPFLTFRAEDWDDGVLAAYTTINIIWLVWVIVRYSSLFGSHGLLWGLSLSRNRAMGAILTWLQARLGLYLLVEGITRLLDRCGTHFYEWRWSGACELNHSIGEYLAVLAAVINIGLACTPAGQKCELPADWKAQLASGDYNRKKLPQWLLQNCRCFVAEEQEWLKIEADAKKKSGKMPPPVFCFETCIRLLAASWEVYAGESVVTKRRDLQQNANLGINPQSGGQKRMTPADFGSFLEFAFCERTFSVLAQDAKPDEDFLDMEEDRVVVVDMGPRGVLVVFRGTIMTGKTACRNWKSNLLACWATPSMDKDAGLDNDDVHSVGPQDESRSREGSRPPMDVDAASVKSECTPTPPAMRARTVSRVWHQGEKDKDMITDPDFADMAAGGASSDEESSDDENNCCEIKGCRCCMAAMPTCRFKDSCKGVKCKGPALAHRGFRDTLLKMLDQGLMHYVTSLLADRDEDGAGRRCYITGHSRGGALAVLFAHMLANEQDTDVTLAQSTPVAKHPKAKYLPGDRITVYTFGCPRVGNQQFARNYNARVPHTFRVLGTQDPVGELPQTCCCGFHATFRHVGARVVVNGLNGDLIFERAEGACVADYMLIGPGSYLELRESLRYHRVVGGTTSYFSALLRAADEARVEVPQDSQLQMLLMHLAMWNPTRTEPWLIVNDMDHDLLVGCSEAGDPNASSGQAGTGTWQRQTTFATQNTNRRSVYKLMSSTALAEKRRRSFRPSSIGRDTRDSGGSSMWPSSDPTQRHGHESFRRKEE
eukprot:Hpha_TRINITY_DN33768_c0_g1::TRINITY_DN33768_c0_g1_i1::g.25137::m.25137